MTDTLAPPALRHVSDDWEAEVWIEGPDQDELRLVSFKHLGHEVPIEALTPEHRDAIAQMVFEVEFVG